MLSTQLVYIYIRSRLKVYSLYITNSTLKYKGTLKVSISNLFFSIYKLTFFVDRWNWDGLNSILLYWSRCDFCLTDTGLFQFSWLGPVSPPTPSLSVINAEIQHLAAHRRPCATYVRSSVPKGQFHGGRSQWPNVSSHLLLSLMGADEVRDAGRKDCGITTTAVAVFEGKILRAWLDHLWPFVEAELEE